MIKFNISYSEEEIDVTVKEATSILDKIVKQLPNFCYRCNKKIVAEVKDNKVFNEKIPIGKGLFICKECNEEIQKSLKDDGYYIL